MAWIIIALLGSYCIGSIPTAYIFGRVLKGIDIRKFGSGNIGATNALRVLGRGPGITVLFLDILKGFLVVTFLADTLVFKVPEFSEEALRIILGMSCIIGHSLTIFLKFKGGKGVATTLGVLLGLALRFTGLKIILFLVVLTWVITFLISKIVSVASVCAALFLPAYMFFLSQAPVFIYSSLLLSGFIIFRHRPNIKRFFHGEEPRLSFKKHS